MTLFDNNGNAIAYIEDDQTIYLWDGTPVAYLESKDIYGFNGKHLGWFEDGILWNHDGERNGFNKNSLPCFANFEPFKSFKSYKPFKSFKEFKPFKPFKISSISRTTLNDFLKMGRE